MITSVMSIHAKHGFTQRIWDFLQGGTGGYSRASASTETSFKILKGFRLDSA